jgi:hypothetical protein
MHPLELRRRALAVVAKLTIFAGAAGCASNVTVDPEETAPAAPDPGVAKPKAPEPITVDPPEAEASCKAAADTDACCNKLLESAFADGHLQMDPASVTPEEKACCDLAVTTMDTWDWTKDPPFDAQVPTQCCSSGIVQGGWEAHPACTPWGPPMPPAMPRHFVAAEVIA